MNWAKERKTLFWLAAIFIACYHLPVGGSRFDSAVIESLALVKWYAREHVLLCLVPAFFIAGAISVFVRQDSVLRYLGPTAPKPVAYGVASISGSVLAVCSCTVLPLFAGIYRMGAGLGPATAFLYAGPAINVLAIILTGRVLGMEIGVARAVGAVIFSLVIGLIMHLIFRREELERAAAAPAAPTEPGRPLHRTALFFADWGRPESTTGVWHAVFAAKWVITAVFAAALGVILATWYGLGWSKTALAAAPPVAAALIWPAQPVYAFAAGVIGLSVVTSRDRGEAGEWFAASWGFAKQILPLLLGGVLVAGLLLGRPGGEGLVPSGWVARAVGGESLASNLFASVAGAFMYFATLTEVPILEGLLRAGMGKGPALALLLAGPALSLPNMLVIRSVMGDRKTLVYVLLVIVMATISGLIYQ